MITLTPKAIEKIKEMSDQYAIGHLSVRVKVIGGGCAGFSYDMEFADNAGEMDETQEIDGITVIVDTLSSQYLEGVEIDWASQGFSEGFKFINPNVKSTCGCGSSVGF